MGQKSSQKWPSFDAIFRPQNVWRVRARKCKINRSFIDVLGVLGGRTTFHFLEKVGDVSGAERS